MRLFIHYLSLNETGHRLRSNTAQRLERLKKEKKSQRKVKNISWRDCPTDYSGRIQRTKQNPAIKMTAMILMKSQVMILGIVGNPWLISSTTDT